MLQIPFWLAVTIIVPLGAALGVLLGKLILLLVR
jgi:uncharacterized membrane-anchored protein